MSARAIACMECEVGGAGDAFQIVRTYIDTKSSIEQDY